MIAPLFYTIGTFMEMDVGTQDASLFTLPSQIEAICYFPPTRGN